jgi:hypothetical protein
MRQARFVDEAAFTGERVGVSDTVAGGVGAGLIAGAAMIAVAMVSAARADLAPARPLELVGATFVGREGLEAGAPALLYGALLWVVVSVALGLLFAAMIPRDFPPVSAAILGLGYSLLVLAIMSSVVLPWVNPTMRAAMPEMGGAWVIAYVVFGLALGSVAPLRQWLTLRARRTG